MINLQAVIVWLTVKQQDFELNSVIKFPFLLEKTEAKSAVSYNNRLVKYL